MLIIEQHTTVKGVRGVAKKQSFANAMDGVFFLAQLEDSSPRELANLGRHWVALHEPFLASHETTTVHGSADDMRPILEYIHWTYLVSDRMPALPKSLAQVVAAARLHAGRPNPLGKTVPSSVFQYVNVGVVCACGPVTREDVLVSLELELGRLIRTLCLAKHRGCSLLEASSLYQDAAKGHPVDRPAVLNAYA